MRLLAIHVFPVWADTTAQDAWAYCRDGRGRDTHPDVVGWANGLVMDIGAERRELLAAAP